MVSIKKTIYKYKRLFNQVIYLRNNFENWDEIIKRSINGKIPKVLNHRNGIKFYGTHMNTLSIFKEVFHKKVYLNGLVKIEQNDIVFDIGANVGVFSLFASEIKGTKVYAFEPHPRNFEVLLKNVKSNNKENIHCLNLALGLKNEKRYLIEGIIPGGHKLNKNEPNIEGLKDLEVETVSLNNIMKELNVEEIDFLKLDCEGAEGEIITSLGVTGLKKIKKITIEFHDNYSILNHSEILNYLQNSQFETSIIWDGKSDFGYIYGIRHNY